MGSSRRAHFLAQDLDKHVSVAGPNSNVYKNELRRALFLGRWVTY
jgi:hypothetical protein